MKRITLALLFACILGACQSTKSLSPNKKQAEISKPVEVVAAVVGYQTSRQLTSGETIPAFLPDNAAGNGDERGVLFYVLSPTNCMGKYFWMHYDGPLSAAPTAILYDNGKRYHFEMYTNDLIEINHQGVSLCTLRPLGMQHFSSKHEAQKYVEELNSEKETTNKKLSVVKNQLEGLQGSAGKEMIEKLKKQATSLKSDLSWINYCRDDALNQLKSFERKE